ncbi:MAG: universal stress protein [Chitinophagaceae bacterium]|nr:MAG: universal stress protein [Chitinophagaceae bacterium]
MKLSINKILVPTDFSKLSLEALEYAAIMCKHSDAEILLLHVIESTDNYKHLNEALNINDVMQEALNKKLQQIKSENVSLHDIEIKVRMTEGKIYEQIEKIREEESADLIVMGTHGASGITNIQRYILGSNAYRVVHFSNCPVIVVRGAKVPVDFKKIVVPLDTTKQTTQKVNQAIKLAKSFDSEIHLISVSTFFEEFTHNLKEMKDKLEEAAEIVDKAGIPVKIKMIRHDNIANSVIDYAENANADLILIMVRAEKKKNDVAIGSSARKIITGSKVPVYTLRPE